MKTSWKKKFDKWYSENVGTDCYRSLEALISELLSEQKQELKKKVEGLEEEVKQLRLERDYWKQKI